MESRHDKADRACYSRSWSGALLKHGEAFMASIMIKVAGEGLVAAAHRLADSGPTSGSSVIYEVCNVPEGVSADQVIAAFKKFAAPSDRYEIEFSELPA